DPHTRLRPAAEVSPWCALATALSRGRWPLYLPTALGGRVTAVTRAEIERDPIIYIQHVDGVLAATSQQFADFREETGREFVAVRAEMAQFREETGREFAAVRAEMAQFREETGREFAAVRAEMAQFREETRGEFAEMRGQLADVNAALVQIVA